MYGLIHIQTTRVTLEKPLECVGLYADLERLDVPSVCLVWVETQVPTENPIGDIQPLFAVSQFSGKERKIIRIETRLGTRIDQR